MSLLSAAVPSPLPWMETRTNAELKKHVDRRDFVVQFWGHSTPCFYYLSNDRQDIFKYDGLQMSGVIKGETVNANELF